jgi:hypothetical protein
MSENPQQPSKSAQAADALDALFRGEPDPHDAPPQTIDGIQIGASSSGVTSPDLIRPDSTGASTPLSGAMAYSDTLGPAASSFGAPGPRRRNAMSQNWRYAIPALAGMATIMFLMALWTMLVLMGVMPSKIKSSFMVALLMVACLLFGLFFVFSCYVIRSELHRQEQNRNRAAAAAQRTNPPAAP